MILKRDDHAVDVAGAGVEVRRAAKISRYILAQLLLPNQSPSSPTHPVTPIASLSQTSTPASRPVRQPRRRVWR